MVDGKNIIGSILVALALTNFSLQDVHTGVDLVTKISNNLFPVIFKNVSNHEANVIVSPFGLLSNLAMLLEASEDKTREELLQTLNISSDDIVSFRKGFKAYCDLFLKYSGEPEASGSFTAASISTSFQPNRDYENILRKYYCANVTRTSTDGGVLELSSVTGVMSHWRDYEKLAVYTFLSQQSVAPFTRADGSTATIPMIPQVGVFRTKKWENARLILLPLQAKLVNLLLIIPDDSKQMDSIVRKVTDHSLPLLVESLSKQEIEVFIPQTAIVSKKLDFGPALERAGIRRVFDEKKADLSKAAADNGTHVRLLKVEQNAYFSTSFVSLNSVSGISAPIESGRRSKRDASKVYIDRPFLFFILQKDTQLTLLAGKVGDPTQIPA